MNKIEIYELSKASRTIRLRLFQDGDSVGLGVVDDEGAILRRGHLFTFTSDGGVTATANVDTDFGFSLDPSGRIKAEPEFGITSQIT
jgi:hypothetical protein